MDHQQNDFGIFFIVYHQAWVHFFSQLTDSYRRESVRCPTFCAGWSTTKTTMPFAAGGLGNTCCAGSGLGGHVFEHFPKNCLELLIVIKLPSRFTKDMKPSHIRSMTCSKLGIYIYVYCFVGEVGNVIPWPSDPSTQAQVATQLMAHRVELRPPETQPFAEEATADGWTFGVFFGLDRI